MSGSTGLSPLQSYAMYSANESKYATASAAGSAQETGLINYFQANAGTITTPSALLKNYKALTVVLGAFGISNLINSTALLQKLMTQDPTDKSSVAYRLGNAKYISFANAMQSWSPGPFSTSSGIQSVITAYKENQFEAQQGAQTPGMQQALYFTRTAGSITSLTQLQSDSSLMAVAVTGLGLPLTAFDNLTFTQQTALMNQKLNLSDLQKPSYVQHLAQMYLVQQQLAGGSSSLTPTVQPGSLVSLFEPSSGNTSGGDGVLTILENAQAASSGTTTSLLGTTTSTESTLLSLFA